jgi:hypothetical protein
MLETIREYALERLEASGEAAYAAAWQDGEAMSLTRAAAYALAEPTSARAPD